ncbi:MAG: sugar phosphate isomerase/epimerase [Alphaproteobacteria bacterium]|nr:sugar phosphate isomerase/epimerase [Alphaproteobacteria bacterium]MBL6777187.1 sugar phosphate isomerase/epimerase [Alphaproteobacteria bacterium]
MSGKTLKQRIGIDIGRRVSVEDGLEWAAKNDVHFIDVQTDIHPNALESFDAERIAGVRALKERHNINLGLHTLSGVNVAEFSPFCRDAVDAYLKAYIDLAPQVGADWIVVHGGYHFTACRTLRMQTAIDRLKRMAGYAEEKGVLLLLENLNWEPVLAEVNYMPVTPAETMHFLTEINSPALRWSFTANHAHFLPGVGISNFIDAVDFSFCHEVRLADNNGSYEIHQRPGEGTIDFGAMFKKIEGLGYKGHYTNGFTTIDDMLAGRDYMVARAAEAGVKID